MVSCSINHISLQKSCLQGLGFMFVCFVLNKSNLKTNENVILFLQK